MFYLVNTLSFEGIDEASESEEESEEEKQNEDENKEEEEEEDEKKTPVQMEKKKKKGSKTCNQIHLINLIWQRNDSYEMYIMYY